MEKNDLRWDNELLKKASAFFSSGGVRLAAMYAD
jgi:hypothetical protein